MTAPKLAVVRAALSLVSVITALTMMHPAQAAGPFDGHWTGQAPYAEGCGAWRFYLDVRDNAVSGTVAGLLNGVSANGDVRSGMIEPDGSATIVWGQRGYRGGFRFSGNTWSGDFVGACGQSSLTGKRGALQTATAQNPYDGDYSGTITLAQTKSGTCNPGPNRRALTISNSRWVFSYNFQQGWSIAGTISADGILSGSGKTYYGPLSLDAKAQGDAIVGTVSSPTCLHSFRLQKLM